MSGNLTGLDGKDSCSDGEYSSFDGNNSYSYVENSSLGGKDSSLDGKDSSFDRENSSFDRENSSFDRENSSFDRENSSFDRENSSLGGKSSCVCAIIPCLNEELVIGSLILKTLPEVDRVIIVDDGSTDRTAEVAELAGAEVIRYEENQGKAYALKRGIEAALEKGCTAAVLLDGDGQHHTTDIERVLAPVIAGEADLVIGSRFIDFDDEDEEAEGGKDESEKDDDGNGTKNNNKGNNNKKTKSRSNQCRNKVPKYRRLGQVTLDYATNLTCDKEIRQNSNFKSTDSQSGFRALGPNALANMDFMSNGYNIESDMITHMLGKGLKICEVPISVRYDVPNKHKKNPITHGFGVLGSIVGKIGYSRPLLVFGIPGLLLFLAGLVSGVFVISEYYHFEIFHYLMLFISFNCIVIGMLLITSGLILNSLSLMMKKG
ncbi:glycosyltransferase family 2 protein [Methanoplanus limicola]|uniref:Glycosyl transferase family 2 n=1 Tax=Methanoplanus limicola DSM 2279 TaxID=937775 RepID=H1Z0D3_9EURY|nr:glycosyltransferase family 2 protein [Methanoplanus limicola]EHQ34400.1 glycosyl transferase family 2 [Methanoplanus limicola DSM 2279]